MKQKLFSILIVALVIHIFSVHCRLLYYLNPEVTAKHLFSFLKIDEPTVIALIFALSYSFATALIIATTKKKSFVIAFGLLDSIAVILYYFTSIPIYFGAFYFAIYTFILIISISHFKTTEHIGDTIKEMKVNGFTQREIATKLKMSESKISRLLNKETIADST